MAIAGHILAVDRFPCEVKTITSSEPVTWASRPNARLPTWDVSSDVRLHCRCRARKHRCLLLSDSVGIAPGSPEDLHSGKGATCCGGKLSIKVLFEVWAAPSR
jgi:hypothetical protein